MIETEGFCCPSTIVAAIYDNLDRDNPWTAALKELKVALGANCAALRILRGQTRPRDALIATAPSTGDEGRAWEKLWLADELHAMSHTDPMWIKDWREVAQKGPFIEQLIAQDVAITLSFGFEATHEFKCTIFASRGHLSPCFSPEDEMLVRAVSAHFRRAFRLRLEVLRGRLINDFQAEALEGLAIAGFFINQHRSMLPLNSRAARFLEERDGLRAVDGFLHAVDEQDDRILQSAIRCALSDREDATSIRGLSIRRSSGSRDLGVVVRAQNVRSLVKNHMERVALIFVRDPHATADSNISLMQQLFSFTRAEAGLATRLAKGMCLGEIEDELNIKHNTARAHLRSMFSKADVNRQSELVHLLANCVLPLGKRTIEAV